MGLVFRPIAAGEMDEYTYTDQVGFGGSTAPDEIQRIKQRTMIRPEQTLCVYDDGVQVAHMAAFPAALRWNGREVDSGCVADVTTLPSHRRRGLVRELMTRYFALMKEREQPVAMLWASMAAIYQRFGYGIAYTLRQYEFDPRHLAFVDEVATPGRTRMVKREDAVPLLRPAYERFAAARTLTLRRDDWWWPNWVLRPWRTPPLLVAVYEEDGEVQGYVIYGIQVSTADDPGPRQKVRVEEFVWNTPAAHRALIRLLAGYDLADTVTLQQLPVDDPLLYQVQEPRLLTAAVRDGTLVRIVDVMQALQQRGYDADGKLSIAIHDDLCPWNAGSYLLAVDGGITTVRRGDTDADLQLSPRVLAILCAGRQSATELARIGAIVGAAPAALATADALFHTGRAPFCADGF